MSEFNATRLVERVNRLERQNRVLRSTMAIVVVILCTVGVTAALTPTETTVTAQRFVLEDERGEERGTLQVTEDGVASLRLFSELGNARVLLMAGPFGGTIATSAGGDGLVGEHGVMLTAFPVPFAAISLLAGESKLQLEASPADGPAVVFKPDASTEGAGLKVFSDGEGSLYVGDLATGRATQIH